MKSVSSKAIVALMTATLGLTALAPVMAQEAAPATTTEPSTGATPTPPTAPTPGVDQPAPPPPGDHGPGPGDHGGGPGSHRNMGLGEVLALERGAEAIEIAIVRLNYALDLSSEQQALLETLKTDALDAAAQFETATEALRPAAPVEGETATMPTLSERFENRIAMEKAHLAALKAVAPAFTAFADSLTDEQQALLAPQPGEGRGPMGDRDRGPGQEGRGGRMSPRP